MLTVIMKSAFTMFVSNVVIVNIMLVITTLSSCAYYLELEVAVLVLKLVRNLLFT